MEVFVMADIAMYVKRIKVLFRVYNCDFILFKNSAKIEDVAHYIKMDNGANYRYIPFEPFRVASCYTDENDNIHDFLKLVSSVAYKIHILTEIKEMFFKQEKVFGIIFRDKKIAMPIKEYSMPHYKFMKMFIISKFRTIAECIMQHLVLGWTVVTYYEPKGNIQHMIYEGFTLEFIDKTTLNLVCNSISKVIKAETDENRIHFRNLLRKHMLCFKILMSFNDWKGRGEYSRVDESSGYEYNPSDDYDYMYKKTYIEILNVEDEKNIETDINSYATDDDSYVADDDTLATFL